jgi:NTP pyrophosphatase (non-canonical NTP hydrolase)
MTNKEILELFNSKFGTSVDLRMRKLEEEFNELKEAHEADPFKNDDNLSDFIDELADLNAVLFHISGILGLSQGQLLSMAVDKVVGREKDPNYKRKHPHINRNEI